MTPKVYNAQSRLLDSVAMVSWPRLYNEKIQWAKNHRNKNPNSKNFKFKGKITFKNVSFNYPDNQTILRNINLVINQNECIGIIGKSGNGKSTLLTCLFFGYVSG